MKVDPQEMLFERIMQIREMAKMHGTQVSGHGLDMWPVWPGIRTKWVWQNERLLLGRESGGLAGKANGAYQKP